MFLYPPFKLLKFWPEQKAISVLPGVLLLSGLYQQTYEEIGDYYLHYHSRNLPWHPLPNEP